jgi:hypothetical protein
MRATIKTILVVALMFGTLISYADDKIKNSNATEASKVKVEFNYVKEGQSLVIKNKDAVTIYKQAIKTSGFYSQTFDLTNLEDGIYTTEIEKDFESIVKKIKVKNGFVTYLSEKSNKVYKPIIRKEGDLLIVSKIEFNKEPLKITLYYKGQIILSDKIEGTDVLNGVYKLSENEIGDYKVVINTGNRTYTKYFTI